LAMPRRRLIRLSDIPYHVTTRSNHKNWFQLPLEKTWMIFLKSMQESNDHTPVEFHAFVLLHNHYHLLLTTPDANIDEFMFKFNKTFSDKLRKKTGQINRMFGGRYKWSLVDSKSYLYNVHRYIFQNPIRAQMVSRCQDYPYSSLFYEVRNKKLPFNLSNILEYPLDELLAWYNTEISSREDLIIKNGLRRPIFLPAIDKNTKRPYELEQWN